MSVEPRRTQENRRAETETALLRAAAELIAERGIERTSLRRIGERAGISHVMPGYYFGSKDGLIKRLAERGHELTLGATLRRVHRQFDDMPRLEALQLMIGTFLEVFARSETPEERAVVVMWGATFPSSTSLPAVLESDRETLGMLAETIRAGQADGSVRGNVDADAAAIMVMGLARGVAAISLSHGDTADPEEVRCLCEQTIEAALRPDPAGWGDV